MSVRLRNIFDVRGLKLAGDLHGLAFSGFLKWRTCGRKTLCEVRQLVHAIQRGPLSPAQRRRLVQEVAPGRVVDAFFVPDSVRGLNLSELPLSVRLEGVLQGKRVRQLGDLHDLRLSELMLARNCGPQTIAELLGLIERAAAGEFSPLPLVDWNPGELIRTLDALVAALPERDEEMLVLRLGGGSGELPTLREVGAKFGLTQERVRQIIAQGIERIRKHGSGRLASHLDRVERFCADKVCPLTPMLIERWLGESPGGGLFGPAFYVRLLGELKPTIPAWPAGQDASVRRRRREEEIERRLEAVLGEGLQARPLSQVLAQVRGKARLRDLEAVELLGCLRHCRAVEVEFPQPDAAVVRLARRPANPDGGICGGPCS